MRFEDLVADCDGFLDVLEADGLLSEAGDGERARDRPETDDEVVVGDLVDVAHLGRDLDLACGVVDVRHLALQGVDVPQRTTVRGDDVTVRDGPGRDLGEERRVGHVRPRVDDDDRSRTTAEALAEAARGVQTHRSTTEHDHAWDLARARGDRGGGPDGFRRGGRIRGRVSVRHRSIVLLGLSSGETSRR